ncbi:MAG: DNA-directed RNA polymerase subunit RpoH/Rpb5 C-terminal domain-containing protein [Candidatus Micrarchaeota archaeon]
MGSAFTHYLSPKIEKMDDAEVSSLLEEMHCSKQSLPLIELSDAGLVGLDAKPGEVVKIIRDEKKKEYYYRLVVD